MKKNWESYCSAYPNEDVCCSTITTCEVTVMEGFFDPICLNPNEYYNCELKVFNPNNEKWLSFDTHQTCVY